jgi:hypothetical protein
MARPKPKKPLIQRLEPDQGQVTEAWGGTQARLNTQNASHAPPGAAQAFKVHIAIGH